MTDLRDHEQYPNPLSRLLARPGVRTEAGPEVLRGAVLIRPELGEMRNSQRRRR